MSIGNLKDQGNKGNNFPYQLKNLQLLAQIANSFNQIKTGNLDEKFFDGATASALESNLDSFFSSNPDKVLVFKSVVYDTSTSKFVAFITLANI
jgi:hypothetical protein